MDIILSQDIIEKVQSYMRSGIELYNIPLLGIFSSDYIKSIFNKWLCYKKLEEEGFNIESVYDLLKKNQNKEGLNIVYKYLSIEMITEVIDDKENVKQEYKDLTEKVNYLRGDIYLKLIRNMIKIKRFDQFLFRDNGSWEELVYYLKKDLSVLGIMKKKIVFIDVETNSLPNGKDRTSGFPIQISFILTDESLNIVKYKDMYINPPASVSPEAKEVHGITDSFLIKNGLMPYEAKKVLEEELGNFSEILFVSHNIKFDIGCLERLFSYCNDMFFVTNTFCTLEYFKKLKDPKKENNKLASVMKYVGLTEELVDEFMEDREIYTRVDKKYHNSLYDTVIVYLIYYWIKNIKK